MFAWRRDRPRHLVVRSLARADEIVVSVRDARIGIDPLHMKHLFNAFFTTKADGMGMGLSICRSIIGAHGGRIWASNNTGSGMTFQIALPLRLGDTS
jgi:signal transduction histidine kinase